MHRLTKESREPGKNDEVFCNQMNELSKETEYILTNDNKDKDLQ